MVNVGLLSEGGTDLAFYEGFLKNLLIKLGITDEIVFFSKRAGTTIDCGIEENTVYFFSKPIVQLAFYITDYDKGINVEKVNKWLKSQKESGIDHPIIFAHPTPYMEQWFCEEQDALKMIFGLDHGKSIVCNPNPKQYFKQLIKERDDYTKVTNEYYADMGKIFNSDKLRDNSDFKNLKNDLTAILRKLGLI